MRTEVEPEGKAQNSKIAPPYNQRVVTKTGEGSAAPPSRRPAGSEHGGKTEENHRRRRTGVRGSRNPLLRNRESPRVGIGETGLRPPSKGHPEG